MKQPTRRHAMPCHPRAVQTFALQPLALAVVMAWAPAWAGPNGAQVVAGQATVSQTAPGQQLITQGTNKAVIDWQGFSIGAGESVRIQQPSASAVLLNRVVGNDPSLILGQMQANGRVFLLNPYGVVFGAGARIDVGGLVASTLDMSNADFMAGNFRLTSAGGPAQRGIVRNDGTISAPGGTVALAGPNVVNTGTIAAEGGRVGLAAANSVLVDVEGDGLIFFQADATQAANRLEQLGRLQADGGSVEVRAAARGAFADTVLNLGGVVQARSLSSRNGRIVIDGGAEGIVQVAGRLDASATEAGQAGGRISVEGQRLKLADGAVLDASGTAGGGTIHVGGGFQGRDPALRNALVTAVAEGATLRADATQQGDGGQVVVWSDDTTRFAGTISSRGGAAGGNGGDVEVSGKQTLLFRGDVDTRAPLGERGTLLLDPDDLLVSNDAGAIDDADVSIAAGGANVTVSANYLSGYTGATITLAAAGNISFENSINNGNPGTSLSAVAGGTLTVESGTSIQVDGDLHLTGAAIALHGDLSSAAGQVRLSGPVSLHSGTIDITGASVVIDDAISSANRALNVTATAGGITLGGNVTLSDGGDALNLAATGGAISAQALTTNNGAITLSSASGLTLNGNVASGNAASHFTGPVTLGADVQVTAGDITFNGSVSGSAHDLSLSGTGTQSLKAVDVASLSTGSTGSTVLQGNVTTSSDQRYANAVTAAADVTLAAGSGTVSFGSTLNGTTADTESVTVTAAGTTFTGAVGGGTRLAALTVTNAARVDGGRVDAVTQSYGALEIGAATTLSGSSVTVSGATTQAAAHALAIDATTTRLGAVTVDTLTVNGTATLNGDVSTSGTQQYANVVLGGDRQLTAAGGSDVDIAGTLTGAHALGVDAGGTTRLRGAVNIGSLATGSGGGTEIGGNVTTSGGQVYGNAVTLADDAVLTAGSAGVGFASTVDGAQSLAVHTSGETRFQGAVGGGTALAGLTTNAGGLTRLGANVSTSGTQTYGDALQLDASATLAATAGNVQFDGTVNAAAAGAQSLTVNASGHAGFGAAVGASAALAGLDVTAATLSLGNATTTGAVALAGSTTLGGSIATNGGSFGVTGPTTLGADTTIDSGSGAIGFTGAVDGGSDGAQSLSLVSSGATTFGAAVGSTRRLRTLGTDAGGSTTLRSVRTSGNQDYGDAVTFAANATLAGADLRFDDTLGGGVALQLSPTGTATLAGNATLQSLTVNGATSLGADVSTTLAQAYHGTLALSGPSTTLSASTLTVTGALDASVAGASALTVATSGAAVFQSAIGATRALGGFATAAGGSVSLPELHASGAVNLGNDATLNGDVFTGGGHFSAAGTTTLAGTTRRIQTGAGDAVFTGAVAASANGVQSLVVDSSGTTRFDAGAGASGQALAGLATDAAGSTVLGGSFFTTGDQLFDDAVTLGATTTIDAGNVHFANGLALGANDLVLQLGGNFDLDGSVGGTGFVSVAPRLASQKIYVGSGTAAADEQQFDLGNLGGGDLSTLPRIGIGRTDGSGTMRVDTLTLGTATKLQTGSGDILLTGRIDGSHQLEVATASGRIELQNINVDTGSAAQTYTGDLVVSGTSVLTGNGIAMHGHVDAAGTGTSQLVIVGSGSFVLDGQVGSTQALSFFGLGTALSLQQDLSIAAGTVTLGAIAGNGHALTVNSAGTTTFGGAVHGLSALVTDAAGDTHIGVDIATSGNQHYGDAVTLDAAATLGATAGSVRFGAGLGGASHALTIDAAGGTTFDGAVSLGALDVRQAATVNGGSVATTGGTQRWRGAVALGAGTTTFTGSGVSFDAGVSGSGALHVNGAATLHADVDTTGAQTYNGALTLAGDLRLASDGSIDFRGTVNGGAHALTLDAAAGSIFRAAVAAGSLDVTGAASLGSVAVTTGGAQRWRGALSLTGNATLASTGAGTLRFDGAIDGPGALGANTAGATQFNAAIGATQALASLTTDAPGSTTLAGNVRTSGALAFNDALTLAADATVTAGSASFASTVDGAHALAVNAFGLTRFDGAVDVASLATDASGSTTLAAGVRTTGAQSFGDRVTLGGDFVIESGGALGFGGGITAGSHTLTLRAGGTLTVGSTVTGSGAAVIEPVAVGTSLGIAGGSGTLQIAQATLNQFSGMPSLTLGRSDGSGAIDVGALVLPTTLTLRSGSGGVTFGGTVDSAAGFAHGLVVDTTALTTFAGSVGAANALGSLSVTHAAQVDAAAVRTSGSQHYAGALGFGADSELHAPALQLDAGLAAGAHDVALFTDSLGLAGPVSGSGSMRLAAFAANGSIGLAGAAGTLQLSQSLLDRFAGLQLHIGRSDGTGALTANSLALAVDTTLDNGSGSVTLGAIAGHGHALAVNSAGTTTFGGAVGGVSTLTTDAAGSTHLAADVATSGNQHYGDALVLDTSALLATAGSVRFGGTVSGAHALTTDAAGGTTFDGTASLAALDLRQAATVNGGSIATTGGQHWGGAVALGADTTFAGSTVRFDAGVSGAHALTVNASTTLQGDVSTTGAQTYGGTLTLADDVRLTSSGSIGFTGSVAGPHALTLDAAGGTHFGGAVSIASLDVLRAASLGHATITTSGAQRWRGALNLTGNATLASTGAGTLRFDGAIDGPGSLGANTAGITQFNAAIGATQALASLTTDAPGSTTLAGNVRTSGALVFNDALTLAADATVTAGSASFASTVDGAHDLAVNSSGLTTFGAAVGGGTALASLSTDAAGSTRAGADITTSGAQHYGDAVALTAAADFTAGTLVFDGPLAAGSFQLGLQADALTLNGTVSGSGTVSLAPSLAATTIGVAGGAGTYQLSQATLSRFTGFSTLAIGRSDGSGDIRVGHLVLPMDTLLQSGSGRIHLDGGVDSAAGTHHDLAVHSAALTRVGGAIGGGTALGRLSIGSGLALDADALLQAAAIDLAGPLALGAHDLTLQTDALTLGSAASGTGTARLAAFDAGGSIGIAGGAGTLQLSQSLLDRFAGLSQLTIGRGDGTGAITAHAFSLPTSLAIESASGAVTLAGAVDSAGAARDLRITTDGLTTLAGTLGGASALRDVAITGAVALAADTTLRADKVDFAGTVDGAHALAIDAATTRFGGAVGATTALTSLSTDAAGSTTLGAGVRTSGAQHYGDDVVLAASSTLQGASLAFAGRVDGAADGAQSLVLDAADTTLAGEVGGTARLAALDVTGRSTLAAGRIATTGAQHYGGAVTLAADNTLSAASLHVAGSVDGAHALAVRSTGPTRFDAALGGTTALASLDLQLGGPVQLGGAGVDTLGAQHYGGALQLAGTTRFAAASLAFDGAVTGAADLTLHADALHVGAGLAGSGTLTLAARDAARSIGVAGGAGGLQVAQSVLDGASGFARHVIGRADGSGTVTVGALALRADTTLQAGSADLRLDGGVNGGFDLLLASGGTTAIGADIGTGVALRSLATDNAGAADWNGTSGEHTRIDSGDGRALRIVTSGAQTFHDPLLAQSPLAFAAATVEAMNTANRFAGAVSVTADSLQLRSASNLRLADVTLANGGSIETDGTLELAGALQLQGGTLSLAANAAPTAIGFTDPALQDPAINLRGIALSEASAAIFQSGGTLSTAAGSLLSLRAAGGGSIGLEQSGNALLGEISAVSGTPGDTGTARFDNGSGVTLGFVRIASSEIHVAGTPPAAGESAGAAAGLEADAVKLSTDRLTTGATGQIRARLPYENLQGSQTSVPGLTLVMGPKALAANGSFGGATPESWIQVELGGATGGYLSVLPKGAGGQGASVLVGGRTEPRPFYDGEGKTGEVRMFYNGAAPRTPQEQGALTAVTATVEEARQARFDDAVRTENVSSRLRAGVIAEVGAGRPATVGTESIRMPETCEPAPGRLHCE